jgi:glycosyltransferase involved in cell wall biosynthesis
MTLNISIGILAHNEAAVISQTLQSLFQQDVLKDAVSELSVEIIVVPNGCTDETAAIAQSTLEQLAQQFTHSKIQWQVCEVLQAGKANAWNLYVHQFSNPAADYLILMDADIEFIEPQTLSSMVKTLEVTPTAWVSVDQPVKDVALKAKKNLMEKLSLKVSGLSGNKGATWICGQLYCGRATVLRKIWMPLGIQMEDSFLWTMIVSDRFTSSEVLERVVQAPSASHIFEAYTDLARLFRHERWLVISNIINSFVYRYIQTRCHPQLDAGLLVKQMNDQDPLWVSKIVQENIVNSGQWVIPQHFLLRRFRNLHFYSPAQLLLKLPIAIAAFFADFYVFLQANQELLTQSKMSYWGKSEKAG